MTSAASQSSDLSAGSTAERAERRLRMLAALEIDVWAVRPTIQAAIHAREQASPAAELSRPAAQAPATAPARDLTARSGAGPAAALALLEASTKAGSARETPASSERSHSAAVVADEPAKDPAADAQQTQERVQPLDLWCLSSPHGVLLAHHEGMSPLTQRLLKDILHSATQVIGARLRASAAGDAPKTPSRTKLQSLRFSWPPATQGSEVLADQDTARALRGFLSRQLKTAVEPVILYVADDIGSLLKGIDLSVEETRYVRLVSPDLLMSDSTTKRALWLTLSAL